MTPTDAGDYTVTVTDVNGCPASVFTTVTVHPVPTVTPVTDKILCNNTTTTGIIFSGPVAGTTFAWTNDTTGDWIGLRW